MSKRLFEALIEANHRAVAGDSHAGLHPADYQDELPLIALTCVDPRLNALLPQALGVSPEQFIWLRNAGNIITGPLSSTMRSLALACAVKGGKEIVIIGHTDCQVGKTTTLQLIDRFKALGVERHMLPDNLNEYFGVFASDRQNVIKAVEFVRNSPLIGPKIPVQGLLIDIETGSLEWLVNGYDNLGRSASPTGLGQVTGEVLSLLKPLTGFDLGSLKFPEGKIGEIVSTVGQQILEQAEARQEGPLALPTGFKLGETKIIDSKAGQSLAGIVAELADKFEHKTGTDRSGATQASTGAPPKIPMPPPIRPKARLRRNVK